MPMNHLWQIHFAWFADTAIADSPKLANRAFYNVQRAIEETRKATGNLSYTPQKLTREAGNVADRAHNGVVRLTLGGSPEDVVFLSKMKELSFRRADIDAPAPILMKAIEID